MNKGKILCEVAIYINLNSLKLLNRYKRPDKINIAFCMQIQKPLCSDTGEVLSNSRKIMLNNYFLLSINLKNNYIVHFIAFKRQLSQTNVYIYIFI